jgi:hypothetical protein
MLRYGSYRYVQSSLNESMMQARYDLTEVHQQRFSFALCPLLATCI